MVMQYSIRKHKAFEVAALVHKGQNRKNPYGVPFVSHCYAVHYLVSLYTNDEDTLIAALLHDAIEDNLEIGVSAVKEFGETVYSYVKYVSEPKYDEKWNKIKWRNRKSIYASQLKYAPEQAKMISAGDKIHNINSLLIAHSEGIKIWEMMTTNSKDQIDRYNELVESLSYDWEHPLLERFKFDLELLSKI